MTGTMMNNILRVCECGDVESLIHMKYQWEDFSISTDCLFQIACVCGNIELVHYLHLNGADIQSYTNGILYELRKSIINYSAGRGHFSNIQNLIDRGWIRNLPIIRSLDGYYKVDRYLKEHDVIINLH